MHGVSRTVRGTQSGREASGSGSGSGCSGSGVGSGSGSGVGSGSGSGVGSGSGCSGSGSGAAVVVVTGSDSGFGYGVARGLHLNRVHHRRRIVRLGSAPLAFGRNGLIGRRSDINIAARSVIDLRRGLSQIRHRVLAGLVYPMGRLIALRRHDILRRDSAR